MKIVSFSCKPYDQKFLYEAFEPLDPDWDTLYIDVPLDLNTVAYAQEADVVTVFVNDRLNEAVIKKLAEGATRLIVLRCTGFHHVDLNAAAMAGIRVVRVHAYSSHAVAEHTIALMMALNRKLYRSHSRIREGNFSLNGLLGFDMYGKTAGIIGGGQIGRLVGTMLKAFGCEVLLHDPYLCGECDDLGIKQVNLDEIWQKADIISMHCPLTKETLHMVNAETIALMKPGVMLINTSRGALMEPLALVDGIKSMKIGYLGLDVYEKEGALFFEDHSNDIIDDDIFERLVTMPNVLITGHQAYFTKEALAHIAQATAQNILAFESGKPLENEIGLEQFG